ncbi:MAG: hypothetical protein ABR517_07825 [Thermoanaerobaculia bacterium]
MRRLLPLVCSLISAVAMGDAVPAPGQLASPISASSDASQTYAVYLPSAWSAGNEHPLLLVFDPRSRGARAAEIFRDAAEQFGWVIVSSNNTRSDGEWEPNFVAVNAIWPEAVQRYAIDPDRIYAAGFSGGAMLAWVVGQQTGKLAGVISVGGRLPEGISTEKVRFAHFGAAGTRDFNWQETRQMESLVEGKGVPHRIEIFEGNHEWFDSELAGKALEWFELLAMRSGARPKDEELISTALDRERRAAEASLAAGEILAASRRFAMIARTWEGLADVIADREKAAQLAAEREASKQRKEEEKWEGWEKARLREISRTLGQIRQPDYPVTAGRISAGLGLERLLAAAKKEGMEGEAAGRVVSSIYAHMSFYLPGELSQAGRIDAMVATLETARKIQAPAALDYNLACAYARARRRDDAFAMLASSIDKGFRDEHHLRTDPDLVSLRDDPRFAALLSRLTSGE